MFMKLFGFFDFSNEGQKTTFKNKSRFKWVVSANYQVQVLEGGGEPTNSNF